MIVLQSLGGALKDALLATDDDGRDPATAAAGDEDARVASEPRASPRPPPVEPAATLAVGARGAAGGAVPCPPEAVQPRAPPGPPQAAVDGADAPERAAELETARVSLEEELNQARRGLAAATAREQELALRCYAAESQVNQGSSALEALLREKDRSLEEREHLVDRRLVSSMLALYLDYRERGEFDLAEQVMQQTMLVLGGEPAPHQRQVLAAEGRLPGPLGDAFLDFLTKEASHEELGGPSSGDDP